MRRIVFVIGLASAAAALAAQQPELKSGIEMANIDSAVRPQDDFYTHVDGTWLAQTEIPADKAVYGAFTEVADGPRPICAPSSSRPPRTRRASRDRSRSRSATSTRAS